MNAHAWCLLLALSSSAVPLLMAGPDATQPATTQPTRIDMTTVRVSASAWEQKAHGGFADFPPANVIDGKPNDKSSWRADGHGQWVAFELTEPARLAAIEIAFTDGGRRSYEISLQVSQDGKDWTEVHRGPSSGKTTDYESFALKGDAVRHIRVVGYGNTNPRFKNWINLNEVRLVLAK